MTEREREPTGHRLVESTLFPRGIDVELTVLCVLFTVFCSEQERRNSSRLVGWQVLSVRYSPLLDDYTVHVNSSTHPGDEMQVGIYCHEYCPGGSSAKWSPTGTARKS